MLSARSTCSASSYESDRDWAPWASCHSEILALTTPRDDVDSMLACANMCIFQVYSVLPFGTGTQPNEDEGNRTHWPGAVRLIRTDESGVAGSEWAVVGFNAENHPSQFVQSRCRRRMVPCVPPCFRDDCAGFPETPTAPTPCRFPKPDCPASQFWQVRPFHRASRRRIEGPSRGPVDVLHVSLMVARGCRCLGRRSPSTRISSIGFRGGGDASRGRQR
jgi:hypothetical protein